MNNQGIKKIQQMWNEDPVGTIWQGITITGAVVMVTAIGARASAQRAYAKQVRRSLRRR